MFTAEKKQLIFKEAKHANLRSKCI